MTDPNTAQATVLIAALHDQLADMMPKLARAEYAVSERTTECARGTRLDAAQLLRDVNHAQFMIARLQRRFPAAENSAPIVATDVE